MNMNTIVSSACLRYIIPFTYALSFDDACALVDRQREKVRGTADQYRKLWKRRTVSEKRPESDLYDYIRDEFLFFDEVNPQAGSRTGAAWIFWSSKESAEKLNGVIAELKFIDPMRLKNFPNSSAEEQGDIFRKALRLKITNLGLYLFRNGLGMVWYELEPNQRNLDSGLLVRMQNLIKELNRANATYLWLSGSGAPPDCSVVYQNTPTGAIRYDAPFSLGQWIADRTEFLPKEYLVERKNAWPSLLLSYEKLLKTAKISVSGFISGAQQEKGRREESMPDKAVLFTYCTFREEYAEEDSFSDWDLPDFLRREGSSSESGTGSRRVNNHNFLRDAGSRAQLAYNLTNGYTDSYDCSPETFAEMRQPFANAVWYATSEGVGYYKWPDENNRNTFESVIRTKASTDYFSLYIKTLYQSYTLMLLAKQIQDEIPAENIEELDDAGYEKISRKYEEVNQFLTRSIVTSVSHIHHQNEYYNYLKKQLRIDEDAKSVSTGLDALDALQKEQRHRKYLQKMEEERNLEKQMDEEEKRRDNNLQEVMGMISLLAIASAFVDCFDFIAKFSQKTEGGWWSLFSSPKVMAAEIILCGLISAISVYAIIFVVKNWIDRKKEKRKDRQEKADKQPIRH